MSTSSTASCPATPAISPSIEEMFDGDVCGLMMAEFEENEHTWDERNVRVTWHSLNHAKTASGA
jgi:hypothetical protein